MKNYKGIFNKINKDKIPIRLILLVKAKDKLRKYLFKKRFISMHWPIKQKLNKASFKFDYYLANHLITIPIDHRYTKKICIILQKQF